MEAYKCSLCNLQFRTIDQMSGKGRLWHHESVNHLAECVKCDKLFTSYTHATVHLYQTHDVRCVRCGDCCEGLCLKDTIKDLENTYNNEKEDLEDDDIDEIVKNLHACFLDDISVAVERHEYHSEVLQLPHNLLVVDVINLHLGVEYVSVLHAAHAQKVIHAVVKELHLLIVLH